MNDKVKEAMIQKAGQWLIANRFELVNGRLDKIVFEPVTTDMAEFALAENADLKARLEAAEAGLNAVSDLMQDSDGVYGLHLNGDISPWGELRTGGVFEDWLADFDKALAVVRDEKPEVTF